jgi:hypothetical protein
MSSTIGILSPSTGRTAICEIVGNAIGTELAHAGTDVRAAFTRDGVVWCWTGGTESAVDPVFPSGAWLALLIDKHAWFYRSGAAWEARRVTIRSAGVTSIALAILDTIDQSSTAFNTKPRNEGLRIPRMPTS